MNANFCLFLIAGILRSLLFSTFLCLQNGAKKWFNWVIINRCLEVTSLVYRGGRKPGLGTVTPAPARRPASRSLAEGRRSSEGRYFSACKHSSWPRKVGKRPEAPLSMRERSPTVALIRNHACLPVGRGSARLRLHRQISIHHSRGREGQFNDEGTSFS